MKTKVLFYCTQAKPYLFTKWTKDLAFWQEKDIDKQDTLNGKIVCECEVECEEMWQGEDGGTFFTDTIKEPYKVSKLACISDDDIESYFSGNNGYALHISNLKVFDEQLELSDVYYKRYNLKVGGNGFEVITKAPQNMMWVWYKGEKYCLISIRPEWLCKILNGEKTIEVRKKILKGML